MGRSCYLCNRKKGVSFHKFPPKGELKDLWLKACDLNERDDVSKIYICSNHFLIEDYSNISNTNSCNGLLRLKRDAIPTIGVPNVFRFANTPIKIRPKPAPTSININEAQTKTILTLGAGLVVQPVPMPLLEPQIDSNVTITEIPKPRAVRRNCNQPRYMGDVLVSDLDTPGGAQRVLNLAKKNLEKKNKTIKALTERNRRLKRKIESLKRIVNRIAESGLYSIEKTEPDDNVPEEIKELFDKKRIENGQYSQKLRSFALTLHLHSPKAYNFVRETWGNFLPHPNTLNNWYKAFHSKMAMDETSLIQVNEFFEGANFEDVEINENIVKEEDAHS